MDDNVKIIKKYKLILILSILFLGIISLAGIIFLGSYFTLLFCLFYIISSRLIMRFLYRKYIASVLLVDNNPQKYLNLFKLGKFYSKTHFELINTLIHCGKYNNAINICEKMLRTNKTRKYKYFYLYFIAKCYFRIDDLENLKIICDRFENELETENKQDVIRKRYPFFEFCQAYINCDYLFCKNYVEKCKNHKRIDKFLYEKHSFTFISAKIDYCTKEYITAQEKFKTIVNEIPNFDIAILSTNYLTAIENKTTPEFAFENILVDDNFTFESEKIIKKAKKTKIIVLITYILAFLSVCIMLFSIPSTPIHFKNINKNTTRDDVIKMYGEADYCEYANHYYYEYYDAEILDVSGTLAFKYQKDDKKLYHVVWFFNENDFKSRQEYNNAVNKTLKHFKTKNRLYKSLTTTEDKVTHHWFYANNGIVYNVNIPLPDNLDNPTASFYMIINETE